jgi:putative ABC transport system permease protein
MTLVPADVRQAVRRWAARPGFALTAILTLGLGIGGTTAIFSVVDGVLLRPLPWRDPDRLVSVWIVRPGWRTDPVLAGTWDRAFMSWPNFQDLQQHNRTLAGVAAWMRPRPLIAGGTTDLVQALQVTSGFLPVLGVQPYAGRGFTVQEDAAATDSVMIAYESWQRRFGGEAGMVGRRVVIDEIPRTVVGVLPPRFRVEGDPPEFLLPFGTVGANDRAAGNNSLRAIARIKPGVTLADAARDIEPILRGDAAAVTRTSRLQPYSEVFFNRAREPLLMLLGASLLLLLIACANVAGLLLGDAGARRHEIAVRRALGAGRARVARLLLAESLVLAVGGGAAGLLAAWWLTPALVALAPERLPRLDSVAIDVRVFAFAAVLSALTTIVFGVGPSLAGASVDAADALRDGRSATRFRRRTQRLIVVGEVALAAVLLAGASLLGETIIRLTASPVGFDADRLVVLRLRGPRSVTANIAARSQELLDRIRTIPGVQSAAGTSAAPFAGSFGSNSIEADGRPGQGFAAQRYVVTDGYFETMRLPVAGRAFERADANGEEVVVVSQDLARRSYNGNAVGRRLRFGERWRTIIGVVPDVKLRAYSEEPGPAFYLYAPQVPTLGAYEILIRATGDPQRLIPALRESVTAFDNRLAFQTLETMGALTARTASSQRYRAVLASAFGSAALILASVGLYGLLARAVSDRRREIGVRMAVGARPIDVARLVVAEGGALVAGGLVVGIPAAMAVARLIRSQLYGVEPSAPHTFVTVSLVLGAVALAATLVPALRASRVDPMTTLRAN